MPRCLIEEDGENVTVLRGEQQRPRLKDSSVDAGSDDGRLAAREVHRDDVALGGVAPFRRSDEERAIATRKCRGKRDEPRRIASVQRVRDSANRLADDPAALAADIKTLALIAVNFPTFKDGRGYSTAYLLRTRYSYTGELRAVGDIQRDQLFYLHRVGFNAFAVREDKDIEAALKSLNDFSNVYQASVVQSSPLFRRREADLQGASTA